MPPGMAHGVGAQNQEKIYVALRDALERGAADAAGFKKNELHDAPEASVVTFAAFVDVETRLVQHFQDRTLVLRRGNS